MTKHLASVLLLLIIGIESGTSSCERGALSKIPLTADQVEVYARFLEQYGPTLKSLTGQDPHFINLANTTEPLELADDLNKNSGCFGEIDFENLAEARKRVHLLESTIASSSDIKLVDSAQQAAIRSALRNGTAATADNQTFETNLLIMSEIVIDKTHRFAAMRFSFSCGNLCGQGGVLIFEKIDQRWRSSNRICGGWIS
jgi:hypothetical protein